MYKVVYLPTARQQLTDAALYIASDLSAPGAAENLLNEVSRQVEGLSEYPYRHAIYYTPFAMKREIRFFPVNNYNVFYVVREDQKTVEIWRSLLQRQSPDRL
jgi:toxin ParE1/3/4